MKKRYVGLAVFLFFLIFIIVVLFMGRKVGLADNGDFYRVTSPVGIGFPDGFAPFFYFFDQYKLAFITGHGFWGDFIKTLTYFGSDALSYITTQYVFVKAAQAVSFTVNFLTGRDAGLFNVRWLGAVYALFHAAGLTLIAVGLFKKNMLYNAAVTLLLTLIFCDIGYLLYFNSFFGEAVIIVSLLLMFGAISRIREKVSVPRTLFFYLAALIFTGAKVANWPMAIFICLFGLSILLVRRDAKMVMTVIACSLALAASAVYINSATPEWMTDVTVYQSVFYGVLRNSPSPAKDLEELGVDKKYAVLADTNAYTKNPPVDVTTAEFKNDFYDKVSHGKILMFYLRHPVRFYQKIENAVYNSVCISPPYLGNYTEGENPERLSFTSRFSFWSQIKKASLKFSIVGTLGYLLLFFIFLIGASVRCVKYKETAPRNILGVSAAGLLWCVTVSQLIIPIIGNGDGDLAKHMFLFILCFDLMIFYGVVVAITMLIKKKENIFNLFKKPAFMSGFIVLLLILGAAVFVDWSGGAKYDVTFGRYGGTDIVWQVVREDENGLLLISRDIVAVRPYSLPHRIGDDNRQNYGSNFWQGSDIRQWLNTEFLAEFTADELSLIKTAKNKFILSAADKDLAEGGNREFYWDNIPTSVVQNYNGAYYMTAADRVFLPDVNDFKYLFDKNLNTQKSCGDESNFPYWLETCYYGNSSMVRMVGPDGFVYHKDAYVSLGVVPMIYVDKRLLFR